ncbi:aminotransferase class V-fold PLP-dependent enzyme [Microlunatus elymi]|uniref:Kynureninase n=1 Tax=Microlunatus elymi TaxID=2596828 RepID=A0A516Q3Y1_9ACTN|nr:aminotransferase class V-fold PLP-dependent enzyme [Microlunatus elymi]QDP98129.1 aminotransferase class V-fold PLP-dependent enzyme [Microlunatus elymi]
MAEMTDRAAELDDQDPLAAYRRRFVPPEDDSMVAYLDGNSLGRPTADLPEVMSGFIKQDWGTRLIRSWDEAWLDWPTVVGDELAAAALGAAPGQTYVADQTSVAIYKLARAALSLADPVRDQIVLDVDNFPTDRYLLEGIASELRLEVVWIRSDLGFGIIPDQVRDAVNERTALFLASHASYLSGYVAEAKLITEIVHGAGGLVLWDCCHSVGAVPIQLDEWDADFAVGCSYKYLNGGPGSPAFGYVATRHQDRTRQPLHGWMGHAEPFEMGPEYEPHRGIRGYLTGGPPILGMVPMRQMVSMINEVGIGAIRAKSLALTDFAVGLVDEHLAPLDVQLASPRDHDHRGGHIMITHRDFRMIKDQLWRRGILPDYRQPDGLRLGLSPLSTSFAEVAVAVRAIQALLQR